MCKVFKSEKNKKLKQSIIVNLFLQIIPISIKFKPVLQKDSIFASTNNKKQEITLTILLSFIFEEVFHFMILNQTSVVYAVNKLSSSVTVSFVILHLMIVAQLYSTDNPVAII